ncbi:MAG: adenosylcobinamide kinase/adenosylcobinamide phosphate guanyltransferase [Panacagrimonas sp.]|jgi:adenosylcobinamide kinase/adenosylcobinamide-phosphate guanylyltransferase|nr:bifunctional adenosylcobinamide kinase/adenosylcobinamide-phosphate guanylyltransferase [Panacagrimonas sp.]MCC2656459.1 adenosylcobinamide kinase/adenosylcobinamide phosphate guanyltransferase [Panacagrimonas sp.]
MSATLILGGVRSGKSRLAERLARESDREVIYVATAQARDDGELHARIAAHRERRPATWRTVEAPLHLAEALRAHDATGRCLLVDCLTLWLTNLLCADDPALLARERVALFDVLSALRADVVLVANETGLGVVPLGELTRRFLDEAGVLHQRLAAHCERVLLTVAGLPLALKGSLRP